MGAKTVTRTLAFPRPPRPAVHLSPRLLLSHTALVCVVLRGQNIIAVVVVKTPGAHPLTTRQRTLATVLPLPDKDSTASLVIAASQ